MPESLLNVQILEIDSRVCWGPLKHIDRPEHAELHAWVNREWLQLTSLSSWHLSTPFIKIRLFACMVHIPRTAQLGDMGKFWWFLCFFL
jgi:hypothetical protein